MTKPSRNTVSAVGKPRIIFNNDGGDSSGAESAQFTGREEFLKVRSTKLAGTHVDTISYSTCMGSFGLFRHQTKIGNVPSQPGDDRQYELVRRLIKEGTDPLEVMTEFGRQNEIPIFWSMRMNDTHDGGNCNQDRFEMNRFKRENPDCLMGGPEQRGSFRKWSAVDYDHEKVRNTVLALIEEVAEHYQVDGLELDFFRHPVFFKNTALGLPVTEAQRETMTDLMRRIRALLGRIDRKNGKALTLAVRAPDDPDYAATIGLDLETWMREGLIDIFIPSCYFRLRSWKDSVELGHRHGVLVYPGLSDSRVGGGHHKDLLRATDECYRGRAACAWAAGADGIYVFNLFNPERKIWSEIGDPAELRGRDKLYFASDLGVGKVAGGAYPHEAFLQIPTLNPKAPLALPPTGRQVVRVDMAEDIEDIPGEHPPSMTVSLWLAEEGETGAAKISQDEVRVVFNGHALQAAGIKDGWQLFKLHPNWSRVGWNTVEIIHLGEGQGLELRDLMVAVDYSRHLLADTSYHEKTRQMM